MKKSETIEKISHTKTVGGNEIKVTTIKTKTPTKKKPSIIKKSARKIPVRKKSVRRKVVRRSPVKRVVRRKSPAMTKKDFEVFQEKIVDNFVSMQKVMTTLAEKFDGLTKQLSRLLNLFDESAKALTEKEINLDMKGGEKEKEILAKLNSVLEQNKLLAKGLTLIHENSVNSINYLQKTTEPNKNPISNSQMVPTASSFRRNVPEGGHPPMNNSAPEKVSIQKPNSNSQLAKSKVIEQEGPFNSGEF